MAKGEGQNKYNWEEMKQEYLISEIWDITVFLKSNYSLDIYKNGNARDKTLGWRDEKIAMAKEATEAQKAEAKAKIKMPINEIFTAVKNGAIELVNRLGKEETLKEMKSEEIMKVQEGLLKIIGELNTININANIQSANKLNTLRQLIDDINDNSEDGEGTISTEQPAS